jgi:restriction system protein
MHVICQNCSTEYEIDDEFGGRWGHCEDCDRYIMLPIPDRERLFSWLKSAPWEKVEEFINNSGARGHNPRTIREVIKIVEIRRWDEEHRIRRKEPEKNKWRLLSPRERVWRHTERRQWQQYTLAELRQIPPDKFEEKVAEVFIAQGYAAKPVGASRDNGIDVEIRNTDGDLWAVAQCKRYSEGNRITSGDIRAFAGAFLLSGATKGYYIATSRLTRACPISW